MPFKEKIKQETFSPDERQKYVGESIHTDHISREYYEEALGISMSELAGKDVLDIGGAPQGVFASEATELGIKLVTLNPNIHPGHRGYLNLLWSDSGLETAPAVGGIVQQLPFKNDAFDCEFAVGSVPGYLPQYESEYQRAFAEIIRTLRPGGIAMLFPIASQMREDQAFKKVTEELRQECLVEFEEVTGFSPSPGEDPSTKFFRMKLTKPEILL